MEQTRIVDRLLFWMAIFLPLFTSGLAFVLKDEKIVTRNRHRWVLVALAGPAVLLLWHVYNRVVDHFGLDSVKGLIVNVVIFVVAALLFTGLRIMLKALITAPPPPPVQVTASIPTQRFTTTRMRSLNPDQPPPPPPPPVPGAPVSPPADPAP